MNRLPISTLVLAAAVGVCAACHGAGGNAADKPAPASQAQAPAIVQPGAPGQASAVVSNVPAFHDNNYTDADVKFMQGMIHHHNQALLMAAMIPTHTQTPQLQAMGQKIQISQSGEIRAMTAWLTARKQEVPIDHARWMTAMTGHGGHGRDAGHAHGRANEGARRGSGRQFDELFLTGMIQHHKGALSMVADLRAAGGAKETNIGDFCNQVDNDQRAEIVRMYGLLGRPVEKL